MQGSRQTKSPRMHLHAFLFLCVLFPSFAYASDVNPQSMLDAQGRKKISVRQISPITFGTFASDGGGNITIDPHGGRMANGGISMLSGGSYGPAEFDIEGQPGEAVQVVLPESIELQRQGGGGMTIRNLKIWPEEIIKLDENGRARVKIGGTLTGGARILTGQYTSLFTFDAVYIGGQAISP